MRASFASAAVIAASLLIPSTDAFAQLQAVWVTAVNEGTALRACPEAKCEVTGKLPAGTTVLVLLEDHGWYWVGAEQYKTSDRVKAQNTWVRAEDVKSTVVKPLEPLALRAVPLWKEVEPTPAEANAGGPPAAIDDPVPSQDACLTCAAPKTVTGSVMLSEDGLGMGMGGGPGPDDPTFEANLEFGRRKFGQRLREAQKRAEQAQIKVNTYLVRCYEAHVPSKDRARSSGVPTSGSRRSSPVNWAMLASPRSPLAWSDEWVTRSRGTPHTMRYCGDLWLGIQKDAGDLQFAASDITERLLDANIYPQAIHRLLVTYNLK